MTTGHNRSLWTVMRTLRNSLWRGMRLSLALMCAFGLMGMTGCMSMSLWKTRPEISKADPPIEFSASSEQILARINENAYSEFSPHGLKSYRCDDVRVRMQGVPAPMRASLVVEAPRNLRLRVANPLSGGEAVDIGSNEQEFWFWAKDSQPANVLVCSHDQIAAATQVTTLPLPFRPDWLMEVLGVTPISGSGYEVHRAKPRSPIVELVSTQRTPDQKPVRRIVKVNVTYGVVLEHRVESLTGQMIAKATLSRHFRDPASGLILPRQIAIDWPAAEQQLALSLEFQNVDFNSSSESEAMWNVPQMAGYPKFDIGEYAMRQLGRDANEELAERQKTLQTGPAGRVALRDDLEIEEEDAPGDSFSEEAPLGKDLDDQDLVDSDSLDAVRRPIRKTSATSKTASSDEEFSSPRRDEDVESGEGFPQGEPLRTSSPRPFPPER